MKRKNSIIAWLTAVSLIITAGTVWASDIKERMHERLPVIADLKARGVVGENNKGYLEFLKGQSEKQDVVQAENNDRRVVYQAIADKQGTTADLVGQRRALQLADNANTGEWLQDSTGNWHRK